MNPPATPINELAMTGEASASGLHRYLQYAKQLGLDVDAALATVGLSSVDIQDVQRRLPCAIHEQLLIHLAALSQDPLFGLNAGRTVQPGFWSVLGYILINCASLGEAMGRVVTYEKLVGDLGVSEVEPLGDRLRMSWHCRQAAPLAKRHMVENVLASWYSYAQWVTDTEQSPVQVDFEHEQPQGVALQRYQDFFACPVFFNQAKSGIVIDQAMLQLPLRQADATLLCTLENHAQEQLAALSRDAQSWSALVQKELSRQLQYGAVSKSVTAQQLGVSERTLQRHLSSDGTSYQQILDALRQHLAQQRIADAELSFAAIAEALGFAETASFHRRFKAWTGMTPGEYRAVRLSELDKGHGSNR
ncbi:MAG: AraC family transcriptional regulator [Oceanococcus sp.]